MKQFQLLALYKKVLTYVFTTTENRKQIWLKRGNRQRGKRGLCDFYVATNCSCRFQWQDLAVLKMETFPNFTEGEDWIFAISGDENVKWCI